MQKYVLQPPLHQPLLYLKRRNVTMKNHLSNNSLIKRKGEITVTNVKNN